jgi:molybdopterin molybdotransferase/putative molybdopterin biosynthesis protein
MASEVSERTRQAARQEQFLAVIDRDEAEARFHAHLTLAPLGQETLPLARALGRVLATPVVADLDVPGFDRSIVDGFAVRSADTVGASDVEPRSLRLNPNVVRPGTPPIETVTTGTASVIATGGMVPRGADAVVMVEHTDLREDDGDDVVDIRKPATPGQSIAFAGSDIARGETVLRKGKVLTSREIGMLAAIGRAQVEVFRRPRVAIISTGDEIIAPGEPMRPAAVYDANAAMLGAAVEELGGEAVQQGISADDEVVLQRMIASALEACDVVLLSGGSSKGAGDLCYRIVRRYSDPGIVAHGVALKPGKPICLAVTAGKPVVILPGFPTSAIFTFHEFVAPVLRAYAGLPRHRRETLSAILPLRIASERGRTEYVMVSLNRGQAGLAAYPVGKGSGAVTAFAQADGFITIARHTEVLPAGTPVEVQLIGHAHDPADLVVIGSHCVGLDALVDRLEADGVSVKALNVGSTGGLAAAKRGECDIAPIHLLDPAAGEYNRPFLSPDLELLPGYGRLQGIVFRPGDQRFEGKGATEAVERALADPECLMINRNAGSGTRILIDQLLAGARPAGYFVRAKSHNAVAVALQQRRADWGVAIQSVAALYGLDFIPLREERYDFVVPKARLNRPAVRRFADLLSAPAAQSILDRFGFIR